MVSFYDELLSEEWPPSYARVEASSDLKVDQFLQETFEATIIELLNHLRRGHITADELAYLEQEAATWFDITLD